MDWKNLPLKWKGFAGVVPMAVLILGLAMMTSAALRDITELASKRAEMEAPDLIFNDEVEDGMDAVEEILVAASIRALQNDGKVSEADRAQFIDARDSLQKLLNEWTEAHPELAPEVAGFEATMATALTAFQGSDVDRLNIIAEMDSIYLRFHDQILSAVISTADHASEGIESISAHAAASNQRLLLFAGLGFMLSAAISIWMMRRLASEVTALAGVMQNLADGEVEAKIPGPDRLDELGAMARNLVTFRDQTLKRLSLEAARDEQQTSSKAEEDRRAKVFENLSDVTMQISAGNFSTKMEAAGTGPEGEKFALQINGMLSAVRQCFEEVRAVLGALADGNLSRRMSGNFSGDFLKLQKDANCAVERLNELIVALRASSGATRVSADAIQDSATSFASRAEQQASALRQTTYTMNELAQLVVTNTEAMDKAEVLFGNVSTLTANGAGTVANTIEAVQQIEESSSKITEIIQVIESIAFQTNLLALNAAVEAARAGEAGKGFAVVASEVRTLSQRSSDAARDITNLIKQSATNVETGVIMVGKTGTALEQIRHSVSELADTMQAAAAASHEQRSGVEDIRSAVGQLDTLTQESALAAEKSVDAARNLAGDIVQLDEQVARFKTDSNRAPRKSAAAGAAVKSASQEACTGSAEMPPETDPSEGWASF